MTDAQTKRINGYLELEIGSSDWILVFKDDGTKVMFPSTLAPENAAKVLEGAAKSIREAPEATRKIET